MKIDHIEVGYIFIYGVLPYLIYPGRYPKEQTACIGAHHGNGKAEDAGEEGIVDMQEITQYCCRYEYGDHYQEGNNQRCGQ